MCCGSFITIIKEIGTESVKVNGSVIVTDERQLFFPVSDNYNSRFLVLPVALFRWANGMKP